MTTIICDSRQHAGKHEGKHAELERMGYTLFTSKVPWGDYMVAPPVTVDTKRDLYELAQNIDGKRNHEELRNACINAKNAGCAHIVLTINDAGVSDLPSLARWMESDAHMEMRKRISKNAKTRRIEGKRLAKACATMEERYGVRFLFCATEEESAHIIARLLDGGGNG